MIMGKTMALAIWTLVDKVMSLLFNMLSRLVKSGENCRALMLGEYVASLRTLNK